MNPTEKFYRQLEKSDKVIADCYDKISKISKKYGDLDPRITELKERIEQEFGTLEQKKNQAVAYRQMQLNRQTASEKKAQKTSDRQARTHRLIQIGAVLEKGFGRTFDTEEDRELLLQYLLESGSGQAFDRWRKGKKTSVASVNSLDDLFY